MLCLFLIAPAVFMMAMSYVEGMANGNRWDLSRVIGLVACLIWPVTLPLLIVASLVHFAREYGRLPKLTHFRTLIARPTTAR